MFCFNLYIFFFGNFVFLIVQAQVRQAYQHLQAMHQQRVQVIHQPVMYRSLFFCFVSERQNNTHQKKKQTVPSNAPTAMPTLNPSVNPSQNPSMIPTIVPTMNPTNLPTCFVGENVFFLFLFFIFCIVFFWDCLHIAHTCFYAMKYTLDPTNAPSNNPTQYPTC